MLADNQLERLEQMSEEMVSLMYQALVKSIETEGADASTLKSLIPDSTWDDPMRDAARCILDTYEDTIGSEGINEMLDKFDVILPTLRGGNVDTLSSIGSIQPDSISVEEAIAINQACEMLELQQQKMQSSEFTKELMKLMAAN